MSISGKYSPMPALQSHHCFQRMRLITAFGTEFSSMTDVNQLRLLQDVFGSTQASRPQNSVAKDRRACTGELIQQHCASIS